jgi:hypothetical protein
MQQTGSTFSPGQFTGNRSTLVLLLSNLLTIVMALMQGWDVSILMWIYWGQSVVIGYFNVHRIMDLDRFSTQGFRINNQAVEPTRETQRKTAVFFAMHYGIFHLVYFFFLFKDASLDGSVSFLGAGVCVLAFYLNHRFSWRYNRARDRERVPNIGNIMFFPYLRIIPMHLTILFGGFLGGHGTFSLLFFLLLKTAADVAMHVIEHTMANRVQRQLP